MSTRNPKMWRYPLGLPLFLAGAALITVMHSGALMLFGWPYVPEGVPFQTSIAHGVQWGLSGMVLLLVGAMLVGPYAGRTLGQNMKLGGCALYGVFVAHAVFDYRFGGDLVDPALYSATAAFVVWFAAQVFDVTVRE